MKGYEKIETDQKEGELSGRIDGESLKRRRRRLKVEHDGSGAVERREEKKDNKE
jgi:hypothetical protein